MDGESQIRIVLAEIVRIRVWISVAFLIISLSCLTAGMFLPKNYSSATTVLAEHEDVLAPLMAGRAVSTATNAADPDRVRLYRERLFNRDLLERVALEAGWIEASTSAMDKEKTLGRLMDQTSLDDTGPNLVRIEVNDENAQRAFDTARLFGELLISESERVRREEIVGAFTFIENQAEEYHQKLLDSERQLKDYRASIVDVSAGTESAVTDRVSSLQNTIESVRLELNESRIRENELEQQLSGETRAIMIESRTSQYRAMISDLQAQQEALRLSYHDTYPEIVTIKYKIADLEAALIEEGKRAEESTGNGSESEPTSINNPLYARLREQLSQIRADSASLEARLNENRRLLDVEIQRAKRIPEVEAALAELNRDYDVNNNVYQDLLRRRENARVSMNMELGRGGRSFRILDPATLPLVPQGLRLLHLALLGPILGLAIPIGLLIISSRIDPRLRDSSQFTAELGVETIGYIGDFATPELRRKSVQSMILSGSLVLTTLLVYAVVGWSYLTESPFLPIPN